MEDKRTDRRLRFQTFGILYINGWEAKTTPFVRNFLPYVVKVTLHDTMYIILLYQRDGGKQGSAEVSLKSIHCSLFSRRSPLNIYIIPSGTK